MARLSNRDIERYYFEQFRGHYALPAGTVEYGDKPDVIIRGAATLGIEMTNLFLEKGSLPESEQIQRGQRQYVVDAAQELYRTQQSASVEFSLGFKRDAPIRDKKALAVQIAEVCLKLGRPDSGEVSRDLYRHVPELAFLYFNSTEYQDARWRLVQGFTGSLMSVEQLKEIINEKEAKAKEYARCDAYWLLVVVDFMDRAQDQEIRVPGLDALHSAVFEKVIIYKTHFGEIVEIGNY